MRFLLFPSAFFVSIRLILVIFDLSGFVYVLVDSFFVFPQVDVAIHDFFPFCFEIIHHDSWDVPRVEFLRRDSVQAIERSSDRASDRAMERSSERSSDRPVDRAIDRASDRVIERSSDRAIERSRDRATERSKMMTTRAPVVHFTRCLVRLAAFIKTSCSDTLPMLNYDDKDRL